MSPEGNPTPRDPAPARVKCLLVDDIDANLIALAALLEAADVEVLKANSGVEALELLLAHDVALALLDVQMPEMDGFQLAELMRGSERTRHVPIIFVTAGGRDELRVFRGYESGAVDFLHKPINPTILCNKAEVFFQLYRQKQQLAHELHERTKTLRLAEMFMAVLGHDLRNPLSALMLLAESIERAPPDRIPSITARMRVSGQRMSQMIDDLLDVVRVRLAGGMAIRKERTDLGVLVQRAVQELQTAHPNRRIDLVQYGDLRGQWDGERLAQVASNLVGNALQHGRHNGAIEVQLDGRDPTEASFRVRNAGCIAPELLPILFDPFRSQSRGGRSSGLGLGLYIVQQIVRAHDGSVALQSNEEDLICFEVRIPRARDGEA